MLRWTCGKTRQDLIRNDTIRGSVCVCVCVGVAPIVVNMVENRLRWFEHVVTCEADSIFCTFPIYRLAAN